MRCCAALLLVALLVRPGHAQPRVGDVQPDQLELGTVYVGATVEASFLVYEDGQDTTIPFTVTAPRGVKILNKLVEAREFGPGNKRVGGSVEYALDTTQPGEVAGEFEVTLGKTKARVPFKATIAARQPGQPRLLIVSTPFQRYSSQHGKDFKPWTALVAEAQADVSYLLVQRGKPILRDLDLSPFTCVMLADEGLVFMLPEDVKRARAYVQGGGRVVLAANYFMRGTTTKANEVLEGYGLQFRDEEAREEGNQAFKIDKQGLHSLLVEAGIQSAQFFRPSPVAILMPARGQALVKAVGVADATDGFIARARARRGEVIAIGQSLWWFWLTPGQAQGTDNSKLLSWLLMPPKGA